jgi:hypothetical protein
MSCESVRKVVRMQDFRQLKVWQKAHGLTLELYELAKRFAALANSADEIHKMLSAFIPKLQSAAKPAGASS